MNTFDAVVYICLFVAVIMGFQSGLLRSLATIFGYITAMPAAIAASPYLARFLSSQSIQSPALNWLALFAVFLLIGMALSALLRIAVSEIVGSDISIADRSAGAMLGAVRVGLLAALMVLIFDRIIPANNQPAFLIDSRLRPMLSVAGQWGLTSLPPGVPAYIDRLKQQHGI
jgi:membrane protein required for colicin V production